jgi:2-succinyl-6-hydroxy-2,4-cyclohexadiene-1-carboxylate synthase
VLAQLSGMSQFIKVEGYRFHYITIGDPSQPALLFLHGFLGDCTDFAIAISYLSQTFYCIAIDLPGHGKTEVLGDDESYSMANTAQALIQVHQQLIQHPCGLMGYSMGGRLGLYLALHFSQYFNKVILESASPGLMTDAEKAVRRQYENQLIQDLTQGRFAQFLDQWYRQPLFSPLRNHPEFPAMFARRLHNNPCGIAKSVKFLGTGHQPSLWEKLSDNQLPLLLLVGELDHKFVSINQEMAQQCAIAELVVVKACGHTIHLEEVSTFCERVSRFLNPNAD